MPAPVAHVCLAEIARQIQQEEAPSDPRCQQLLRRMEAYPDEPNPGDHAPPTERAAWRALAEEDTAHMMARIQAIRMELGIAPYDREAHQEDDDPRDVEGRRYLFGEH